jgi:carbonic anhydrase
MDRLLTGYRRFRRSRWPERRRQFETLADTGQRPRALVISCADSRVDPGMIFDAGPGELFVVRNVANLVPPFAPDGAWHGTSAALEYAVRILEVPDILVMGHAMCGGVRALLEGAPADASDFIEPWIRLAAPARDRALARTDIFDRQLCCEQETIRLSLANLLTFPWIASRLAAGTLRLHGAHFDIRAGELSLLDEQDGFVTVPGVQPRQKAKHHPP